jgi:hypothetical protein
MSGTKGKKALYCAEAQHLYITELLTLEDISKRLNVSTRTLQDWKAEGDWDKKKSDHLKSKTAFKADFITFAQLLIQRVNRKLEANEDVASSELYTVSRLACDLLKETIAEEVKGEKPDNKSIQDKQDVMTVIDNFLKGLV